MLAYNAKNKLPRDTKQEKSTVLNKPKTKKALEFLIKNPTTTCINKLPMKHMEDIT